MTKKTLKWRMLLAFGLVLFAWAQSWAEVVSEALQRFQRVVESHEAARSIKDLEKVASEYERVLKALEETGAQKEQAAGHLNLGDIRVGLGDPSRAIEHYLKAEQLFDLLGEHDLAARAVHGAGLAYLSQRKYHEATTLLLRCAEMRRQSADADGVGRALNDLGIVYGAWSHYERGADCFRMAVKEFEKAGSQERVPQTLMNLGNVHLRQGLFAEAVDDYAGALARCEDGGDSRTKISILHGQAVAYQSMGQYERARACYVKASAIAATTGDRHLREAAWSNLGDFYSWWNQYERAERCYRQVLVSTRLRRDTAGTALALTGMGKVAGAHGQLRRAIGLWEQAIAAYRSIGLEPTGPLDLIANAYLDLGEVRKAETCARKVQCPATLGRLFLAQEKYQAARKTYEEILKTAQANHDTRGLFISTTGLGAAHEGLNDMKTAEIFYRQAKSHARRIRESLGPTEIAKLSEARAGGFRMQAPAEGRVRVFAKDDRPVQALMESDRIKAEQFSRFFESRHDTASFGLTRAMVEKEDSLNQLMSAVVKEQDSAYSHRDTSKAQVLDPRIQALRYQVNSHRQSLRKQNPDYVLTRYPEHVQDLLSRLDDDQWVLAYEVTDTATIAHVLRGKSVLKSLVIEISREVLEGRVTDFRDPLDMESGSGRVADKLKTFDFRTGKELFDRLVSPALSDIPEAAHVVIVPDDCLHLLPFEALPMNDKGQVRDDKRIPYVVSAKFFGDRNPISYSQSIASIPPSRGHVRQTRDGKRLLTVADPVFRMTDPRARGISLRDDNRTASIPLKATGYSTLSPGASCPQFRRLPLTSNLATCLASMYGKDVDTFTGLKASKDNIFGNPAVSLDRYRLLLFATHGYIGNGIPGIMEPVLILTMVPPGTDGFLRVSEVMSLSLNADIAVLAACRTALGEIVPGPGVVCMGRAFQYAGARSSLMTLWSIAEEPSVQFVENFFTHLKAGKNGIESLRLAREHLRKNGYDHPFFWAPFILVGEARGYLQSSAH